MELKVCNLSKSFQGKQVLHDIEFSIQSGTALGLLGRNGAGKSTTIRILMDVFKSNQGKILIDGKIFNPKDYQIGYLPEERGLYAKLKVKDQLIYFAKLRGLTKKEAIQNMRYYFEKLNIMEYENRVLETLSKGNQQKVQLVQTLICKPDIVILDEPFSGLDPVNAQLLKELVQEIIQENKIVIFSSHQMNYVEEFCEEIVILKEGRVVLSGNTQQLKKEFGQNQIILKLKQENVFDILKNLESIEKVCKVDQHFLITLQANATKTNLIQDLLKQQLDIDELKDYEVSLQDIFVEMAGDH